MLAGLTQAPDITSIPTLQRNKLCRAVSKCTKYANNTGLHIGDFNTGKRESVGYDWSTWNTDMKTTVDVG